MKALVIDDDQVARKILAAALEKNGWSVIQSGNGKHGWETLWENQDIAMIVSDLAMPDMDGRELVQLIRGNQAFDNLAIVIVSGVIKQENAQDLLEFPHCRFCRKPVSLDVFKQTVAILMEEVAPAKKH
jgi:CheY-like chemotaxis protein